MQAEKATLLEKGFASPDGVALGTWDLLKECGGSYVVIILYGSTHPEWGEYASSKNSHTVPPTQDFGKADANFYPVPWACALQLAAPLRSAAIAPPVVASPQPQGFSEPDSHS